MHEGMIDDSDVMTLNVDRTNPQTVYATACTGHLPLGGRRGTLDEDPRHPLQQPAHARVRAEPGRREPASTRAPRKALWMSEDGSATWRLVTPKDLVVNAVLPLPGGPILLGTEGAGVLRSLDGGRTWAASNEGFSERFVSKVVFDRPGRRVLAAIWGDRRYGGVFVAPGARGPWTRIGKGLEGRQVLSLALLGRDVLAGTDDGIFAWDPDGNLWTRLPTLVDRLEAHPRVTDLAALAPRTLIGATSLGLIRSADGGRTWTRPTLGMAEQVTAVAVSPSDIQVVVASTPLGIFRSTDGGETWTQAAPGLGALAAHALAFAPSDDRVLFATTSRGLFRSEDQGLTWARVTGGIPFSDITGIAVHPDGRTIYASDFTWGGIFRSVDGGRTWERMPTDGLASDRVWTLGLDPGAPDRLLAASPTGGLHLLVPPSSATGAGGSQ